MLTAAAFGSMPGISLLPEPTDELGSWYRAVALGGQGRYHAARSELRRTRSTSDSNLLSLTWSTEGSWWRQLGWYQRAQQCDGAALRVLDRGDESVAAADALIGLAADALGLGRYSTARRLLERGSSVARHDLRARIRLEWVSAELAMAIGDAESAVGRACAAVALAETGSSLRHRVKSALLSAAALTCLGRRAQAVAAAEVVAEQCRCNGLLPLQWATAMLRTALTSNPGAEIEARECALLISHRGGEFRSTR